MNTRIDTLYYNGRFLATKHPTGTHRSALMFLKCIAEKGVNKIKVVVKGPSIQNSFVDITQYKNIVLDVVTRREMPKWQWHTWEQLLWPNSKSGIAINPINTGPFIYGGKRHIMFAHDINVMRYPSNYNMRFRLWNKFATIIAMRRAGHLVCFTNYVKNDLQKLGISKERITVIHQGPGLPLLTPVEPKIHKAKYFLCVGSMQPHKNFSGCVEAWNLSGLADRGYRLKVVGKPQQNFTKFETGGIKCFKGIEFTGYISDLELIELYKSTTGFLYPSFEEGFGLPIVEAFYLGAPVVTSNCSCLPEVSGNAAINVDPKRPSEIANALNLLANDEDVRYHLMKEGTRRANLYNWESAGTTLLSTIGNMLKSRAP